MALPKETPAMEDAAEDWVEDAALAEAELDDEPEDAGEVDEAEALAAEEVAAGVASKEMSLMRTREIVDRRTAGRLDAEVRAVRVDLRRVGRVAEHDLVVVTRAEGDVGHREGLSVTWVSARFQVGMANTLTSAVVFRKRAMEKSPFKV